MSDRYEFEMDEWDTDRPENVVYVVGLGPGDVFYLTQEAQSALEHADAICGYKLYIDLIEPEFPCEEYYATGMTQEIDRCRWALEKARTGKRALEEGLYSATQKSLAHDFCVISLSDRLTPWEVIEKRLACAAQGDFCVALYNPSSKGRPDYLQKAVRILRANGKADDTVCGLVRNIGREGQSVNEATMVKRLDQQFRVTRIMMESFHLYSDVESSRLRSYMMGYFTMMMAICSVLTKLSEEECADERLKTLWNDLKAYDERMYRRARYGVVGFFTNLHGRAGDKTTLGLYRLASKIFKFN